jgi:hypothetical protein
MTSGWPVALYRFMMQAYPAEFRNEYGESVDQAFRDTLREAFRKRGYLGLALLWFHVIPDFLFSAGELLLARAGDFLKWRFRLQWVVACSLGFGVVRCFALIIGPDFYKGLEGYGVPGIVLGTVLKLALLMCGVGILQAWVLAGRCFRKKAWVLYGLAGAVLAAVVLQPVLLVAAPAQIRLLQVIGESFGSGMLRPVAERVVTGAPFLVLGALAGLLQSRAIRNDVVTRYRWMRASAAGYFLSALAGGFVIPYPFESVVEVVVSNVVAGTVLGLFTAGPLERILFTVELDAAN